MAMPPDTAAVTVGSAHCGGKWYGCAKISPMNVAIALIVACRAALCPVHLCEKGIEKTPGAVNVPDGTSGVRSELHDA